MTKILVIEDEDSVRENILDLLEAEDFETIEAGNGRVGLNLATSEVPDLILCDLMLPEIDGYGVLTALREEPITATIPFIFLTARSARTDFRLGMDLGADDYITKPFTRAELLSAISSRLAKQATLTKYLNSQKTEKVSSEIQVIEKSLRHTIEECTFGEFQIYYQPQVNIVTGEIIAAESLIRWHSPELGMVSPSELIPLAESTGLIIPLGDWILESVCKQIKMWHNVGFDSLRIAINLSAHQLTQPNFTQKIFDFISTHNLSPQNLELELTESMIMQDVNNAISVIQELRSIGVQIAIDDFGTGYTSLIYLKKLPINTLKIDRYFIHNVADDTQKAAITKALIQMAHNLNFQVVAEGVETEKEMNFLRQHNCDAMQGFIFSRPLPLGAFEKFLYNKNFIV
ncbi:EAL domain-containing response regulator [Iningainema tapete]|uniref:EAL domain-containing response regulator n=1 Tax=Iningainema tapete BLCC-T55 TaxID=2748662 RepID=A0A8J6XP32_9CYAN|nr:EAL domain-containing response regulator [Iningainema tapete]MBD2774666.1 EAL domain-containing response regulator [Iningainema tapete BLCC-T55]